MPGIITLLDDEFAARVRAVQEAMASEFGVARGYPGDLPHFTYHLSDSCDLEGAAEVAARISAAQARFTVSTSGFGVFTGAEVAIYIPIARNDGLAALHRRICEEMDAAGQPNNPYYHPDRALPHITIAQQNLRAEAMPGVLAWLTTQDLSWNVPVTNLALADQSPFSARVIGRWELQRG